MARAAETSRQEHTPQTCNAAITQAFGLLGKRWNGVIVATLDGGPIWFSHLALAVTGISDSELSERRSELAEAGLVQRNVQTGPPIAVSYQLTESGHALRPAMAELERWASKHFKP